MVNQFFADIEMNTSVLGMTVNESFSERCENVLNEVGQRRVTDSLLAMVLVTITLVVVTVTTFINNIIVLVALTLGRGRPSSYCLSMTLTLSSVTADLLLSVGVMPFAVYNVIGESWILGKTMCRYGNEWTAQPFFLLPCHSSLLCL